ncbi:MAG: LysM peptidoglycan-binding domain-containing protein [bacterium]
MRILKSLLLVILFFSVNLVAQTREMTEEEWQNEVNSLTQKKTTLTNEATTLQNEVKELKAKDLALQTYENCMDELYTIIGATKSDIDNFRTKVNTLNGKIEKQEGPKNDRVAELNELKLSKIGALPEFYNKVHVELPRKLEAWVEAPTEINYTVIKGDCLWNIAKKPDHYSNAFAWPKIYEANKDQIKNPNLIYPKQIFKIPNLTEEEKAKYDKIKQNYKPAPPKQTTVN